MGQATVRVLHYRVTIDDDVCHLPKSERFELTIPLQRANAQERQLFKGQQVLPPNDRLHIQSQRNLKVATAVPSAMD